ncbi:MAG: HAD hydrolase family protein [Deltaproteobacteria bacterium]|jgi:3-deoxy-D-manno-octulosonate 8-phosphate phosphatase (KDO 8-P phosphatase)
MKIEKLKNIDLLLLDVDGVLTDGGIIFNDNGHQTKVFNSKDGFGIQLLMKAGVQVGLVTANSSQALRHRCDHLGVSLLFEGVTDKASTLASIAVKTGVEPERTAFVGDDMLDIPMFHRVAVGIAVCDAHEAALAAADLVTKAEGGHGAVREVCDAILKAKGLWEKTLTELS